MKHKWLEFYVDMRHAYRICDKVDATHKIRTTSNTYSVYLIEDGRRQVPDKTARRVIAHVVHHMYGHYLPSVCG